MNGVAILGYASMDHVLALEGPPALGRTTHVTRRDAAAWGRPGGAPYFVARAMAAAGVAHPAPVSWIGDDADGAAYRAAVARCGADDRGLAVIAGGRTPLTMMVYDPTGECMCLYDALEHAAGTDIVTPAQADLIATARCMCLTVAPAQATRAALALCADTARVAWVAKHDARALPDDLLRAVAGRADIIFFSETEGPLVRDALAAAAPRAGRMLVETHGPRGAVLEMADGRTARPPVAALRVDDPCGAGDTLAGGMLAHLLAHPHDPVGALDAGIGAAFALLESRQKESRDEPFNG
ncbi:carbohydrate kinase family protein [Gluconacetobacter entanii]|uniref:Carbohydrate kinase family protein n=1 Tax=Gluconacetobacter entanii TaxID=108528 RepID=A0ABT3K636_9PROT|nr:carbohydrate kinase family protein [Gluconacetobacter entanii]MCW4590875.1 carbohydrate kinase family protein [Gluconacetobacter entanii]MCW4593047.1 carbohydrate kinase family protein [Gluconacetobacter entanii]NPC90201.1 carbohydrate kinase family protein [Gluconacetobacter entanii]